MNEKALSNNDLADLLVAKLCPSDSLKPQCVRFTFRQSA